MLFMVVENFAKSSIATVGERFKLRGRMLPEGVVYHASWVEPSGARCFQIMEAASLAVLKQWTSCWDDLVEFEIVPVLTSADYWSKRPPTGD